MSRRKAEYQTSPKAPAFRRGVAYPSGAMSEDNTWLYLIGDYQEAYIFAKNLLKALCVPENKAVTFKEIPTAQGYIFPLEYVERKCLCAKHIIFKSDENS